MLDLSKFVVFPEGNSNQIYRANIYIENLTFHVRFTNPSYLKSTSNLNSNSNNNNNNVKAQKDVICEFDGKLSQILFHSREIIRKRLFEYNSAEEFINNIYNILYKSFSTSHTCIPSNISSVFYHSICRQLDYFGGCQYITNISSDFTEFTLNIPHKIDILHELQFKIIDANSFPDIKPVIIFHKLPLIFEYKWTNNGHKHSHIANVISQYYSECFKYKIFWKILSDFYSNCIVLEPKNINYSCNILRILLNKNKFTSIEIKINPLKCSNICECAFYGINSEINRLKSKWNLNKNNIWNNNLLIRENIENILNIEFDAKLCDDNIVLDIDTIISEMECSICLEPNIPNITCKSCKKGYHRDCLLPWFDSQNTTIKTYTSITGKCPQCTSDITVQINEYDSN